MALLGPTSKAFPSSLLLHLVGVLYNGKTFPAALPWQKRRRLKSPEDPQVRRGSAEEALTP